MNADEYRIVDEDPYVGMGGPNLVMVYRGDVCVKGNLYRKEAVAWIAERATLAPLGAIGRDGG